jgi:N-acetylmuramoyl-L-alanine amidase
MIFSTPRCPRSVRTAVLTLAVLGAGLAASGCAFGQSDPAGGAAGAARPDIGPASRSAHSAAASSPAAASPSPSALPLAGQVVGIDPGHDGGNFDDPGYIDQQVWNGEEYENCDTTGTQTASGFTEASFNFDVATYLRADLMADGATVVMTRQSNDGVGPCVTTRAQIINSVHADVAIDIHADGGPEWGRGFTVLEPVADGPNDAVIGSSEQFGADVRAAMLAGTSMPVSDYYGTEGVISRDDLAGLNLTTVPKVLVECGNMPNPTDASMLEDPAFQQQLAQAFTTAIISFLGSQPH